MCQALSAAAAATEDKKSDDDEPNPVIVENSAKTVVHKNLLVKCKNNIERCRRPHYHIMRREVFCEINCRKIIGVVLDNGIIKRPSVRKVFCELYYIFMGRPVRSDSNAASIIFITCII